MGLKIENGRKVTIAYRILDHEGRVLDEKTPAEPHVYIQGDGEILPAVERSLIGKTPGFQTEVSVSARDAYGEYDQGLVTELPRSDFPPGMPLDVDMKFDTLGPDDEPLTVRVIEISKDAVTIDGNHPLAGIDLIFDIRVLHVADQEASSLDTVDESSDEPIHRLKPGSTSLH